MKILKRNKKKRKYLEWWNILVLTFIMFGYFIYISLSSMVYRADLGPNLESFTSGANWSTIIIELVLLSLAFLYLFLRNFDFSQWTIKFNIKSVLKALALFVFVAILFDLYFILVYTIIPYPYMDNQIIYESQGKNEFLQTLLNIDLSLFLFSILNRFYEEIFFLGVCLSLEPDKRKYGFVYSLIVRYSFHTYQVNISALAIGLILGTVFYIFYTRSKYKNLVLFFLAHSLGDLFGVGIISYFL